MIKKIVKIKDFGVFKNFNGNSLPEFQTFNLIYGWNYSGKTTLSRAFRCLEKSKLHDDYLSATFELTSDAGNHTHASGHAINIRVFNSDFIKENLKWDNENIQPILILGEENIELQNKLKEKEAELLNAQIAGQNAKDVRQQKLNALNGKVTDKAREVGNLLSLRPFNAVHLTSVLEKVKNKPSILNTADFDKYKLQALSSEQKPHIGIIAPSIPDLKSAISTVEEILGRQITSGEKIEKFLTNAVLSSWVEQGKELHKDLFDCQFCGSRLPADLIDKLNNHFSKDFERLKSHISTTIDILNRSKITIANQLPVTIAFYPDLQEEFIYKKNVFETEIQKVNSNIDSLIDNLEKKKMSPFDIISFTPIASENIVTALAALNKSIQVNNTRTSSFAKEKQAAIEKLKDHYASEFDQREKYFATHAQLVDDQKSIDALLTNLIPKINAITEIKKQLDETVKGAEKINDYLKIFFGKDDIQIAPNVDKTLRLMRGTQVARNLSEGEKTAIAFAYFATKIEELGNKICDTIIYIDDPISSLDSNHLFNIYSFIKNIFYEFRKDGTGKNIHTPKCKQLFISTHNFEFYNLIYDWFKKLKKEQQAYFTVERRKNAHTDDSVLMDSNHLIRKFKSEYVYLFSIIYKFYLSPTDTFDNLYHLPNILRRFVETFLNFKYLSSENIEESLNRLITDPIKCERARKFMHYFSHSLTTDKLVKFADLSECADVIKIILESLKNNDLVHYESLVASAA